MCFLDRRTVCREIRVAGRVNEGCSVRGLYNDLAKLPVGGTCSSSGGENSCQNNCITPKDVSPVHIVGAIKRV